MYTGALTSVVRWDGTDRQLESGEARQVGKGTHLQLPVANPNCHKMSSWKRYAEKVEVAGGV